MSTKITFPEPLTEAQFKAVYYGAKKSKFKPTIGFTNSKLTYLYYKEITKDKVDSIKAYLTREKINADIISL